jgi:deoxyribose-phosphate aldolase
MPDLTQWKREAMSVTKAELVKIIDSTNVKMTATRREIEELCRQAVQYGFGCVCVNPTYVKLAATILKGSKVKVSSTVGFPFGSSLMETKAMEAFRAVEDGAKELDMVINMSLLKSGDYSGVRRDIAAVTEIKRLDKTIIVKVIIETAHLTKEEKIMACRLAKEVRADFVKTSTGFFGLGATAEDVRLMRETVGKDLGVKAAGGIRNYADALRMIDAGANRIGTSSATEIIKEAP